MSFLHLKGFWYLNMTINLVLLLGSLGYTFVPKLSWKWLAFSCQNKVKFSWLKRRIEISTSTKKQIRPYKACYFVFKNSNKVVMTWASFCSHHERIKMKYKSLFPILWEKWVLVHTKL